MPDFRQCSAMQPEPGFVEDGLKPWQMCHGFRPSSRDPDLDGLACRDTIIHMDGVVEAFVEADMEAQAFHAEPNRRREALGSGQRMEQKAGDCRNNDAEEDQEGRQEMAAHDSSACRIGGFGQSLSPS